MATALECTNVSFGYDRKHQVLDDITFSIDQGQIFGLLGPNGAGKSTLVKILLGLNKPGGGTVRWFGEELTTRARRRIGYVPQDLALLYDLSAEDNVRFFGRLNGLSSGQIKARTRAALDFVGLWAERKKQPGSYSGGMKRRLNIACGIVHEPDVVIMDEPTVGVDPQSRNRILEAIEELRDSGTTIIYISHYMEEVERLCSSLGIIDDGTYLCGGTLEELLSDYAPEAIVNLELTQGASLHGDDLTGLQVLERTDRTVSVAMPDGHLDDMGVLADRLDDKVQRFTYIPPNLEQVFFRLTRKALRD
ncbi:ABC transporter ATP-binding protein [Flexivirga oryzae]|uniref:ABC-2 type transport system ATP-binding protein n=1 Tax=Flexivirga oryzae TaxID=1794944 RepID=A0A839NDJ2_9MICO|nr:ABC transporter ATP-binding protein [Flexivirga oryzae]MBB2893245.1 ABC-2 type transport system ATP-binding protein [Flexivirga oryzae]